MAGRWKAPIDLDNINITLYLHLIMKVKF